jgi:predicted DCC family thiol-disulfide oxidoreductase YuxK
MAADVRYPLTVFYDASCPMCSAEMRALKRRDAQGRLILVDCSAPDFDETVLAGVPIRRADLMTAIHARDAHGRWFSGIEVFELAYGAVGLDVLAGFWGSRILRPVLDRVYPWVARHRQFLSRLR